MTFLTRHHRVQAEQRELREIVVECDPLAPSVFVVAGFAFLAEFAFMRVVLFVAGHACGGEFILVVIVAVTAIAFGFSVFAAKWKLRLLVVVEADHVPLF